MTEQEIRRALAICAQGTHGPWITSEAFSIAALDPVTGYAATLRALLEARDALRWRDVKQEMPKAGRPVLAFFVNDHGYGRRIRAEWSDGHSLVSDGNEDDAVYDEKTDELYCPEGWYESNEFEEIHWRVDGNITHWLPLPPMPVEARAFLAEGESK